MKNLILTLATLALSLPVHAEESPGKPGTIQLECSGTLQAIEGNFDDGFTKRPVSVGIKIGGPVFFRYGTRFAYDDIEVTYESEVILIKNVQDLPEYRLYDLNFAYRNLLLTDFSWYQDGQNMDGSLFVTPNSIKIVALPLTMNTTGEGEGAQDGDTHSTFKATVDLTITDGSKKTDYNAHTATGELSCVYDQKFPQ